MDVVVRSLEWQANETGELGLLASTTTNMRLVGPVRVIPNIGAVVDFPAITVADVRFIGRLSEAGGPMNVTLRVCSTSGSAREMVQPSSRPFLAVSDAQAYRVRFDRTAMVRVVGAGESPGPSCGGRWYTTGVGMSGVMFGLVRPGVANVRAHVRLGWNQPLLLSDAARQGIQKSVR